MVEKTFITKWGMRLLALVIWLTFSFVTCLCIMDLWASNPGMEKLILFPLTSIIAGCFERVRARIMREMRKEYTVVKSSAPERDRPWEPQAWPVGTERPI